MIISSTVSERAIQRTEEAETAKKMLMILSTVNFVAGIRNTQNFSRKT
jgi:hypothetical protein